MDSILIQEEPWRGRFRQTISPTGAGGRTLRRRHPELWLLDLNDPDNCKLLRYINLPSQWMKRSGSGFDTLPQVAFRRSSLRFKEPSLI